MLTKRELFKGAAAVGALGVVPLIGCEQFGGQGTGLMKRRIGAAAPISRQERSGRVAKAQRLMQERGIGGVLLEPGASMDYFSGLKTYRSERLTAVVIPVEGDIAIVTPSFEERTVQEKIGDDVEIRTWKEHENPFALVEGFLDDRGSTGSLAIEASVRYFVSNGIDALSNRGLTSGDPIVNGCRMIKSAHEIELMQTANDITMAAYRETYGQVVAGMTPNDIRTIMLEATKRLGGMPTFSLVLLGEASSYPHGSDQPQLVTDGKVILMDCGCDVHGYKSDISRTWVHGDANEKQRRVWDTVRRGQEIALETAVNGVPAGRVDDAVRAFYEQEGFGPDYNTPGLTHRLGHGIGMEVHEPINFVRGEEAILQSGMCFSNEPGIYIPGEFGMRHEDCLYMTDAGPKLFSGLSPSIEDPLG